QGVQGKIGLTGDTGSQGVQGKKGDQGEPGPIGQPAPIETSVFLALATDQTIGTTGKYIGLGSQAGDHDRVSVVIPSDAGATVTMFVAKVSQGNTARFGDAFLYKDGPTGAGTLIGACSIDPDVGDPVTTCMIMVFGDEKILDEKDSLSCFIKTDGGSFEAGSCSILIDLGSVTP
ncbi:MAG: collagen-like protein, partial [Methylococcales bacterium]|nr:collagen-like protein [Methylococcales bacterium]